VVLIMAATKTLGVVVAALMLDLVAFACILPAFPAILDHYEARAPAVWCCEPRRGWLQSRRAPDATAGGPV
jgi:hypothetical protein